MNITIHEAGRRASLKDIRLDGAIITASKVYEDGGTGSFSGVFANRILNGRSAFGIIVDNLHIELDGITLSGLFFKLSESPREPHSAVDESNVVLARSEIEARHAEIAAAIEAGNIDSLETLRTENFLAVMPDGEIRTGEQSNQHMRTMLSNTQPPIQISSTIDRLILIDDEAIAVVHKEFSGTQDYLGRLCVIRMSVSLREIWTRTYDGWKLKMVDNIRYQPTLVDGEPMDQSAEGAQAARLQ
jgi:ketosteroid isomerase-like protein